MNDELFNSKTLLRAIVAALIIAGIMLLLRGLNGGNINLLAIGFALLVGGATSYLGIILLIGWSIWKESPGAIIISTVVTIFIAIMSYLFNYH